MGAAPAIAPGLVIADRYRVEALLSSRNPGQRVGELCRAYDEVLARQVALLLVPEDDPGVPDVLAGARAAARLTHAALVRVYDAGEVPGLAFVVTEFLSGGSLEEQLLVGPLDPDAAVDLVTDLSTAVAAAHEVGLHGLSLTPRNVLFTATGVPRLAGIALAGHTARDAGAVGYPDHLGSETSTQTPEPDADQLSRARFDAVGLARLLYAALTGRWPGPASESSLPPAPYAEGHLCTPRQVRGGVPREVDAVVAQALGDDLLRRGLPAIASPAEFAAALAPLRTPIEGSHPFHDDTAPIEGLELRRRATTALPSRQRWRVWAVLIGVVLIGVAVGALLYSGPHSYLRFVTGAPAPTPNHSASATQSATPNAPGRLTPRAVSEFDPYGDHTDPHIRGPARPRRQSGDGLADADLPHRRPRQAEARRGSARRLRQRAVSVGGRPSTHRHRDLGAVVREQWLGATRQREGDDGRRGNGQRAEHRHAAPAARNLGALLGHLAHEAAAGAGRLPGRRLRDDVPPVIATQASIGCLA